jgi:hypothetical protein
MVIQGSSGWLGKRIQMSLPVPEYSKKPFPYELNGRVIRMKKLIFGLIIGLALATVMFIGPFSLNTAGGIPALKMRMSRWQMIIRKPDRWPGKSPSSAERQ